mgnify:FL=1
MSTNEPAHGVVRRILVGVDGSEDGLRAVRYATRAALVTGAEEWIVNVADPGAMVTGMWELVVTTEALQKAGQTITAEAVGTATGLGLPSARVTSEVLVGQAADVLGELSAKADLLVVGRRSMSGLERMFVGSTSVSVAALAHCPVVVISSSSTPQETGGQGTVAVAISTWPPHSAALDWGVREAAWRKARLRVVHVVPAEGTQPSTLAEATAELEKHLAPLREQHPDTAIDLEVLVGTPIDELITLSGSVDLLILGVHPEHLRGLARGVLAHAHCPVGLTR